MLNKLSVQKRILIAAIFSIMFFMVYDYLVLSPLKNSNQDLNKTTTKSDIVSNNAPTKESDTNKINNFVVDNQIENSISVITSSFFEMHIDKLGRISKLYLNQSKFKDQDGNRIQLIDSKSSPRPLEVRFQDKNLNEMAFNTEYQASFSSLTIENDPVELVLTQSLGDVTLYKKITFFPDGHYDIEVSTSKPLTYFITPGFRPNQVVDGYTFHGSIIKTSDGTLEKIDDGSAKEGMQSFKNSFFAASSDRYYTTALYSNEPKLNVLIMSTLPKDGDPILFIEAEQNISLSGYIGPKEYNVLKNIDSGLSDIVEYGFFTFLAKYVFMLLAFIYQYTGNWGWSIVVMTILIRFVLYPLTYKGMVSMNKLKELAPKIKELQAKYKGDPQKLNMHMMEMYKKHGANPMGGCLPILLQIPIFFAIYRVLQNAVELKDAPWIFWIQDLSIKDPYFILPIAMGLTMFFHQKITPMNFSDPMQEKIMRYLPLIFTFFFITFPAGLTLYWFVNNLFSIAQQYYVNKIFAQKKEAQDVKN